MSERVVIALDYEIDEPSIEHLSDAITDLRSKLACKPDCIYVAIGSAAARIITELDYREPFEEIHAPH